MKGSDMYLIPQGQLRSYNKAIKKCTPKMKYAMPMPV